MNLAEVRMRLGVAESIRGVAEDLLTQETREATRPTGESAGTMRLNVCICGASWDRFKPRDERHELGCPCEELRNLAQELEAPVRQALQEGR